MKHTALPFFVSSWRCVAALRPFHVGRAEVQGSVPSDVIQCTYDVSIVDIGRIIIRLFQIPTKVWSHLNETLILASEYTYLTFTKLETYLNADRM